MGGFLGGIGYNLQFPSFLYFGKWMENWDFFLYL